MCHWWWVHNPRALSFHKEPLYRRAIRDSVAQISSLVFPKRINETFSFCSVFRWIPGEKRGPTMGLNKSVSQSCEREPWAETWSDRNKMWGFLQVSNDWTFDQNRWSKYFWPPYYMETTHSGTRCPIDTPWLIRFASRDHHHSHPLAKPRCVSVVIWALLQTRHPHVPSVISGGWCL